VCYPRPRGRVERGASFNHRARAACRAGPPENDRMRRPAAWPTRTL